MKRRLFCGSILALLLVCLLPLWAAADTGPKPSITVTPEGFGEDACYLTLLSQTETTGPWSKQESFAASKDSYGDPEADEAIWTAFNDYQDAEGFFFLGCYFRLKIETRNHCPRRRYLLNASERTLRKYERYINGIAAYVGCGSGYAAIHFGKS